MDDEGAIRLRRVIVKVARQLNASSTGAGLTPSLENLAETMRQVSAPNRQTVRAG
jgi:hypothetical protein